MLGLCTAPNGRNEWPLTADRSGVTKETTKGTPGCFKGCFNSMTRGHTMPAFTFEKIPPPVRRGPLPPVEKKQRGVIVQILDRFVEARVKRSLRKEERLIAHRQRKSAK